MNLKRLWLIKARKSKNMSRVDLAEAIGVNFTYIEKIENGKRMPSYQVAKRIGDVLDIPEDEALLNFYSSKSA